MEKKLIGKIFLLTIRESFPKQQVNFLIIKYLLSFKYTKNFQNIKLIQIKNISGKYFALIKIGFYMINLSFRNAQ